MYLSAKDLAERWNYETPKPIYAMKDEIGYVRIGGKVLFPLEKVEEYERTHTVLPNKEKETVT